MTENLMIWNFVSHSITGSLFLLFLAGTTALFFISKDRFRHYIIAAASMLFYYLLMGHFIFLLLAEVLLVYLYTRTDTRAAWMPVVALAGVLAFFKFGDTLMPGAPLADYLLRKGVLLPLGLSFFTFNMIHFVIDYRKGKIRSKSLVEMLSFGFFFPTVTAGPLRKFQDFKHETDRAAFDIQEVIQGSARMVMGFFKKIVIADSLYLFATDFQRMSTAGSLTTPELWISVFAYSFMILFDFSAIADIAIGASRVMGISVPENFRYPYLKRNISQFWKSWHITLYRWLIEYIYKPLGGSRVSRITTVRNIFIVFFLIGIWHGETLNFMAWGLFNGFLVSVHHLYSKLSPGFTRSRIYNSLPVTSLFVAGTFILVSIGWVFFAAENLDTSLFVLGRMFGI